MGHLVAMEPTLARKQGLILYLRCALVNVRLSLEDASETCFKGDCHRFDCRLGPLWH
jgi:hypothetical protein